MTPPTEIGPRDSASFGVEPGRELADAEGLVRQWLADVAYILRRDWYLGIEEVAVEQLRLGYELGESPAKFVAWFAEKYDLYDFNNH